MSDPKRANLITVGAPKSAKVNVKKTVRLTINLDESNESKYPELDYKELVTAEASKQKRLNGKTAGLDPFSDFDEEVERDARKFEQKYGGNKTYGKGSRKESDYFADIGAGYDENDSFIDNTDGYDEIFPPGIDTLHGGFYINCGSLEFTTVPEKQNYPEERNKSEREKSSSSSSSKESESSTDSDSQDAKQKGIVNGNVDSHKTEHRKKKNKKIDKKKKSKIRRTDSSAPTSGKQTSDDNGHGDGESGDSRTSQSDSLTSKPAPSSENAITSDSSRDAEQKVDMKQLPVSVNQQLEELEVLSRQLIKDDSKTESYIGRLERALAKANANDNTRRLTLTRVAKILNISPESKLLHRLKHTLPEISEASTPSTTSQIAQNPTATATVTTTTTTTTATNVSSTNSTMNINKRKAEELDKTDINTLTAEEKVVKIEETLERLKKLIEERTPDMMATYHADCARVQEEKKKLQIATQSEGAPHIDKRRPKRRFPWCPRSRFLLARLAALAGDAEAGASLLSRRALPLFPAGFARMPTLLKQADLNKEVKASDIKRPRLGSSPQSVMTNSQQQQFVEPIQFPSSLTVTTTSVKNNEKIDDNKDAKYKVNSAAIVSSLNPFFVHKELEKEKPDERKKEDRTKEDTIPNNIGSITITPVVSQKDKPSDKKEPLLRVKSPAALNEMVSKKDSKTKKPEKKRIASPLHIDTNHSNKKELTSPKSKDEVTMKQIESMRIVENNIPRPVLVSVHHSPTFPKPDKRAPEVKKKKDVLIISDQDPLADNQEPLNVDDSSSDVEFVEDKSEPKCKSEVPLKGVNTSASVKQKSDKSDSNQLDEATQEAIEDVMRNIREIKHSQAPTKLKCNSYGGVITSAKREMSSKALRRGEAHSGSDIMKINFFKQIGWMSPPADAPSALRDEKI